MHVVGVYSQIPFPFEDQMQRFIMGATSSLAASRLVETHSFFIIFLDFFLLMNVAVVPVIATGALPSPSHGSVVVGSSGVVGRGAESVLGRWTSSNACSITATGLFLSEATALCVTGSSMLASTR